MAKTPSLVLGCSGAQTGAAVMAPNRTHLGCPPELEAAIEEELSVLGSIEARYTDELARLEQSDTSGSAKERLRQQLEWRRKSAREPHVLKVGPNKAPTQICQRRDLNDDATEHEQRNDEFMRKEIEQRYSGYWRERESGKGRDECSCKYAGQEDTLGCERQHRRSLKTPDSHEDPH